MNEHVARLGRHDRNIKIKKSLTNLWLRMFELIVELAPTDCNSWLNYFKKLFRISCAVRSVMGQQ